MWAIPRKKYKVTKDDFMEMILTVVYVDTWIFDYEGYWNNKYEFKRILSEKEFSTIQDKYKEIAVVFAYHTTKFLKVYEYDFKEIFLKNVKYFYKEEEYSDFSYEKVENLINRFGDLEFKESDYKKIYEYWVNEISEQYKLFDIEKKKEIRKIIELINLQIIRKINRLYEETKFKK